METKSWKLIETTYKNGVKREYLRNFYVVANHSNISDSINAFYRCVENISSLVALDVYDSANVKLEDENGNVFRSIYLQAL